MGQLLNNRYQFVKTLSVDPTGQTVLADDTQASGRPRCVMRQVKLPSSNARNLEFSLILLKKEAESLKSISYHPQIPQILDCFYESQNFYLVEEYIPGHSLATEMLPGQPLSTQTVISLMKEVLGVLDFVHDRGLIHRRLKPSNLIRRQGDGRIVLTGFGIFKEISAHVLRTQGQMTKAITNGTTVYISPEQGIGKAQVNNDLYALGIIAIQALTGQTTSEVSKLQNSGNGKEVSKLPNSGVESGEESLWLEELDIHPNFQTLLEKMVHPDGRQRYQAAREILTDLRQLEQELEAQVQAKKPEPEPETEPEPAILEDTLALDLAPISFTEINIEPSHKNGKVVQRESLAPLEINASLTSSPATNPPLPPPATPSPPPPPVVPPPPPVVNKSPRWLFFGLAALAFIVGFVGLVYSQLPQNLISRYLINQGQGKVQKKDLETALANYNRAIELQPGNGKAYYQRALVYQNLGNEQAALDDLTTAIKLGSNVVDAYYQRGNMRFAIGDRQGAIDDYNQALQVDANYAKAYVNRGNVYAELGDEPKALADYNQAIAIGQEEALPVAYLNRCLARTNLKDYGGALEDCNKAISLRPTNPLAYQNRGLLNRRIGELTDAIEDYNIAIKLEAKDADPYYNRGLTRKDLGDLAGAVADLTSALELNPDHVLVYHDRGLIYAKMGNREAAIADFQQAAQKCLNLGRLGCYEDAQYELKKLGIAAPKPEPTESSSPVQTTPPPPEKPVPENTP